MPRATIGAGTPLPTADLSNLDSADNGKIRTKRRTSELRPSQSVRSGWLARWFSEKFRLDGLSNPEISAPSIKSYLDNTISSGIVKTRAASCLKNPDQVRRKPTIPNSHVQFTMPPKVVVVNREDLCFSRQEDSSSSEEPARFDLAEFANASIYEPDDNLDESNTS